MTDPILLERPRPEIAFLRLNRPDKLNALNLQSLSLLLDALDQVDEDDACRVLIITGQGRGFCSGLDLDPSTAGPSPPLGGPQRLLKSMRSTWTRLLPRLRTLRPAVIAAV